MEIAPKALYNALRIGHELEPDQSMAPWKVEDLRRASDKDLFKRLVEHDILLDQGSFVSYADAYDSPEELAVALLPESMFGSEEADQIYLVVFELWRRFLPEKRCITLIADELDHMIFSYDHDLLDSYEPLDDALASFYTVLQENVDAGASPVQAFSLVCEYVAHDLTTFLYDYFNDLIDSCQDRFASEQVESYYPFISDKKWFELLRARLDPRSSFERIGRILKETEKEPNLALNIDMLSHLSHANNEELFCEVALKSVPLLEDEDDLEELLNASIAFFYEQDNSEKVRIAEGYLKRKARLTDAFKNELKNFYKKHS